MQQNTDVGRFVGFEAGFVLDDAIARWKHGVVSNPVAQVRAVELRRARGIVEGERQPLAVAEATPSATTLLACTHLRWGSAPPLPLQ